MYVPKCKAIHPKSVVLKTKIPPAPDNCVVSQPLLLSLFHSISQSLTCWNSPFHFSFVHYLSPEDLLYSSFCRLSLSQGKLPWSKFFVLLFVGCFFFPLRNSAQAFFQYFLGHLPYQHFDTSIISILSLPWKK